MSTLDRTRSQLLVLASGDLGRAVAAGLAAAPGLAPTVLDVTEGTHPSLWPHADAMMVCAASERPRVCEAVDATAFVRRIPWVAVHARPTELQAGPVVVPGRTACHGCYVRRRAQHGGERQGPDAAPVSGPTGFARHHVAVLTALARQALTEALTEAQRARAGGTGSAGGAAGTVRTFNLVTGTLARHAVVAVDCCSRCRGRFGDRERGRARMWSALSGVVASGAADEPVAVAS